LIDVMIPETQNLKFQALEMSVTLLITIV